MRELLAMMRKEFTHILRDPYLLGFALGFPILLLLLFGYALRLKVDNLVIAVWDQERNFFSVSVKDQLRRAGNMIVAEVDSEQTIRDHLRIGTAHMGLIIPKGFSERLGNGDQTTFLLFIDGTMPAVAQSALYGAQILISEETSEALMFDDADQVGRIVRKRPIRIDQDLLFNPSLRDSDYLLPGTIGVVIMLVTLVLCLGLVREKEQQTFEQLLVTPISKHALIVGKMIPYGILAAVDFAVALAVARLAFALPVRGSLLAVALLAGLFILALLALGSLLSTLAQTQMQDFFMTVIVLVVSVLMSGFVFPIESMPQWLRPVSSTLPLTYFAAAARGIMLKGVGLDVLWGEVWPLALFGIAVFTLSALRFRKQLV